MSEHVILPALGESVSEGTITRWLKSVGEHVALDEALLEVSTDKVDTEIPSPVEGTLLEIKAAEDEVVPVGGVLAIIGNAAATTTVEHAGNGASGLSVAVSPSATQSTELTSVATLTSDAVAAAPKQPGGTPAGEPWKSPVGPGFLSPVVRSMATESKADLRTVRGTGSNGRIRREDLVALLDVKESRLPAVVAASQPSAPTLVESGMPLAPAVAEPKAPPPSTGLQTRGRPQRQNHVSQAVLRGHTEKLSQRRRVIAARMVESLQTSAQLTQVMEVDMTDVVRLRDQVKEDFLAREGVKLTFMPFFALAAIDALKRHPKLNASIDTERDEVTYYSEQSVAIAVDTERGLMTPVVRDAGHLSLAGLARSIADLADRARTNRVAVEELSGGTFTLTNLGSFGALFDTPIVNQPQVAILGPGAVMRRPVVVDSPEHGMAIAIRHMAYLALSYDHRLVDGADAGRFLMDVKNRLEAGQFKI
jgi:pyruvate dehydrogenase E2 component (dihydrolipoamide acetyltransferase)